jgi:hypothetical protein
VPLDFLKRSSTKNNTHVDQDIVSYFCGLSDNNTHAMIDYDTPADFCSRVNLNAGEKPANMRDKSRSEPEVMKPKPMGTAMKPEGMEARIT